ncbi:hypothetical protein PAI11_13030 [Patulibacter medicamentivorans]|uniref:Uncharacterized protein n=1 Tax=Patulibacter medicamentivorans TaxID=1097667 RepID=H0E3D5_9ACTN|nr:hypothetical protein PAI11_13030 [Patulibacter medicamentivorans]
MGPQGTTGFDAVVRGGDCESRYRRPRKTPVTTIRADSHEFALAA